jgi:hypothetical protein
VQLNYHQDRIKKIPAKTNSNAASLRISIVLFSSLKNGRFKPAQNPKSLRAICAPQAAEGELII